MSDRNPDTTDQHPQGPQDRLNATLASNLWRIAFLVSAVYLGGFIVQYHVLIPVRVPPLMWSNLITAVLFLLIAEGLRRWPPRAESAHAIVASTSVLILFNMLQRIYTQSEPLFISVLFIIGMALIAQSPRWFIFISTTATLALILVTLLSGLDSQFMRRSAGAHSVALLISSLMFVSRYYVAYRLEEKGILLERKLDELAETNRALQEEIVRRDAAHRALEASEERYRRLVELSPLPIIIRRGPDVLFANQATLDLLGAECAEDVTGRSALDFICPEDRDLLVDRMRSHDTHDDQVVSEVSRCRRLDGTVFEVEISSVPVMYEGERARLAMGRVI